jgi:hypothetical protein
MCEYLRCDIRLRMFSFVLDLAATGYSWCDILASYFKMHVYMLSFTNRIPLGSLSILAFPH